MFQRKGNVCMQNHVSPPGEVGMWQRLTLQSVEDIEHVIGTITAAAMATVGFSEKDTFRLHLALEEALVNAHKHGHQGDWSKTILVRYHVNESGVVTEIEDQGMGFDPEQVPDPLAPENLERPSGRGLHLMRTYMAHVCHNDQGNCICLCKHCPGDTNRRS